MNRYPKISRAERIGRWLGRVYRGLMRQEHRLRLWLIGLGLPATGAKVFAWSVRILIVVSLLCVSITLTALFVGLVLIGRGVARSGMSQNTREAEWRNGDEGYGFYEKGVRTDFGRLFDDDKKDV